MIQHSQNSASRVGLTLLLSAASLLTVNASVIRVWEGNTDANLSTASNWIGGVAPVGGNAIEFGSAGSAGTSLTGFPIVFGYNSSIPAINFTAGASAYTYSGSGSIGAGTGGITNASGQTQTFNTAFRFNTGTTHSLLNANSALAFGGQIEMNSDTTTFALGSSTGQSLTFGDNLILGTVNPSNPKSLQLNGGANASTVTLNGATNTGLTSTLRIGQNVRTNIGSSTGLSAATTVNFNASGAQLVNTSGSALSTNASLAVTTNSAIVFGQSGDTAANSIALNGTSAISADLTRSITLNGTGLSVSSGSVWNSSVTGSRTLTVNGAGNTFSIGGIAIGASGETANVILTIGGTANLTVSNGMTNGLGTGTRGLQHNGTGTLIINGASNYSGTTGVGNTGGFATLLVNGTHTGGQNYSVAGILGGTGTIDLSANNATINYFSGGTGRLQAASADGLTIIGGASSAITLNNSIDTETGNLLFTLNTPGTTLVDVQGLLTIGAGFLDFGDFAFTTGTGFGLGTYRLFEYNTLSGSLGSNLTGTVGGFDASITLDAFNSAIVLNVVPEPSPIMLFALSIVGLATIRRRREI